MRTRLLDPGFFTDDELAECQPLARLLFAGLWCVADPDGRLQDRPRKIKAEVLPYDECDVEELLTELAGVKSIIRYEVDGCRYIQVPNFRRIQKPHYKEKDCGYPPPPGYVEPTLRQGWAEVDSRSRQPSANVAPESESKSESKSKSKSVRKGRISSIQSKGKEPARFDFKAAADALKAGEL
jgi:hypothetical protein